MTIVSQISRLLQDEGPLFLTDSGLETTLVFLENRDLPCFASCVMHFEPEDELWLQRYYNRHAAIAAENGLGFVFESTTWRASPDWGDKLGLDEAALYRLNLNAIRFLRRVEQEWKWRLPATIVSGNVGPRGDGYSVWDRMTAVEASDYHSFQARAFAESGADVMSALTMTHAGEAAGVVRAAAVAGLPSVISFTVETDGNLPDGQPLAEAIAEVDAGPVRPAYYMINCAHPSHFLDTVSGDGAWRQRIRGLRVNASCKSHEELDNSTELDAGDPVALGRDHRALIGQMPWLRVFGGCCGTDHRHVGEIARTVAAVGRSALSA